ncbi:MAG TPA: MGMT family protein, partial [Allosphingosinicella sp.]|nr:MGMT family protein [Allosphingosinicella sp.]
MASSGIAVFETSIGACGVAWRPAGLAGLQLPEASETASLARLRRRFPDLAEAAPPQWVARAIAAIRDHLSGSAADLAAIALDFGRVGTFEAAVYRAARQIPSGSTVTYGELARHVGEPGSARAVGQALGRNP